MLSVAVISASGIPLMPTTSYRARKLLEKNERIYRARKVSKGRRSIRTQHYRIQPGDIVRYEGNRYVVKGRISLHTLL